MAVYCELHSNIFTNHRRRRHNDYVNRGTEYVILWVDMVMFLYSFIKKSEISRQILLNPLHEGSRKHPKAGAEVLLLLNPLHEVSRKHPKAGAEILVLLNPLHEVSRKHPKAGAEILLEEYGPWAGRTDQLKTIVSLRHIERAPKGKRTLENSLINLYLVNIFDCDDG